MPQELYDDELVFYHFNDVYHINQPRILPRFSYFFQNTNENHLTIFSGDAFSPSLESSLLKGEHMVPVLNHLGVDVGCYGNHDFDFGETQLVHLSSLCNFPWVLSNAFHDSGEHRLLASAKEYHILTHKGYRIGFFGLAGSDWPSNTQHLPRTTIISSPIETALRISKYLREEENVDFVVALTHMRLEEDMDLLQGLAEGNERIDLILGGHDHDLVVHGDNLVFQDNATTRDIRGDVKIVKSGTDFKSLSIIKVPVRRKTHSRGIEIGEVHVHQILDLLSSSSYPADPTIPQILSTTQTVLSTLSSTPLFRTLSPLDGRSNIIRNYETNLGNLLSDIVRAYYGADIGFVNSGSVRCDRVVEGVLSVRDVVDILPFSNSLLVKRLPSHILYEALENSFSDARTDGRFLQLSGIKVNVDLAKQQGQRVLSAFVRDNEEDGQYIRITRENEEKEHERKFTVVMTSFIAEGFDGFSCLQHPEVEEIVGKEGAMTDTGILLDVFQARGQEKREIGEEGDEGDLRRARAREAVLVSSGEKDGLEFNELPVVDPKIEDRILYV
ncbi:hypothetical protein VKT23_004689 [Stygiomarasmius scandens]|uniref:Uncharacterized protein n=1 Tax=Marasmiellus scandens TaxID=2682957 RepID=A0ABR1JVE0_9AGAR